MISFDFAGKNSFTDFGIQITTRPVLPSPARKITYIDIPGRDSDLRFDEGTFEDITISVECSFKKSNLPWRIDDVKAWLLLADESDLIFSFQNTRKYKAQVVNQIDFSQTLKYISKFVIIFNCQPFKYAVSNNILTVEQSSGIAINYPGNVYSRPVIKVYCEGDGTLKVKDRNISFTEISEYIVLNSRVEEAYYMDENEQMINANNKMSGEFPILEPGSNSIVFTGGVTKIEIAPHLRWI